MSSEARSPEEICRLHQTEPEVVADLTCPDCGVPMVLRLGTYGRFYGCANWENTKCPGTVSAHDDGTPYGLPARTGSLTKIRRRCRMEGRPLTAYDRVLADDLIDEPP